MAQAPKLPTALLLLAGDGGIGHAPFFVPPSRQPQILGTVNRELARQLDHWQRAF